MRELYRKRALLVAYFWSQEKKRLRKQQPAAHSERDADDHVYCIHRSCYRGGGGGQHGVILSIIGTT